MPVSPALPAARPAVSQTLSKASATGTFRQNVPVAGPPQNVPTEGLPVVPNIQWERNARGGFEAWYVPPGAVTRKEKTYLVYLGKRVLDGMEGQPDRDSKIRAILEDKMAEKGIGRT